MKKYTQLTSAQRAKISKFKGYGWSMSEIARRLGVHKSTISRELSRNGSIREIDHVVFKRLAIFYEDPLMLEQAKNLPNLEKRFEYFVKHAQQSSDRRRLWSNQARTRKHKRVRSWVVRSLKKGWTPTQIAGRSEVEGPEKISHEAVYQIVYRDKKTGGKLHRLLPRFRKRKQRFNPRAYQPTIIGRIDIRQRPEIVKHRLRLGDLEADLVTGYKSDGYVLVVVDRVSRQVVFRKLQNKTQLEVLKNLKKAFKTFSCVHTLTVDNGREFSAHLALTKATGVPVFFTTPYTSQERGTVENTNGLLRRYLPKKSPFKDVLQKRLRELQRRMNHRPRKVLGFLTPFEFAHIKTSNPEFSVALHY